jgi:ArsR family transcriptional regulator, arsenate/arsenite/antimonite-responsive transcriptional repressor
MKTFLQVMKTLSSPHRLKILTVLQTKALCVSEIQLLLGHLQPVVSIHLAVLEAAGLVRSRKQGLRVYNELSDGSPSPYAAKLLGNLRHLTVRF